MSQPAPQLCRVSTTATDPCVMRADRDLPTPQPCQIDDSGAAHRAMHPNRERYFAQSAGVVFGVLPERLADLHALAARIHRDRLLVDEPDAEPATDAPPRPDADDLSKAVRTYARGIGCDASNTRAAIAWALKSPGATLQALAAGRQRAAQLRARQI